MTLETLPCGCRMGKVGDIFMVYPCSLDCVYYQYVVKRSKETNKPLRFLIDPNTGLGAYRDDRK